MKIPKHLQLLVFLIGMYSVSAMAQTSIDLQLKTSYLHLPVSYDDEDNARLELVIDGMVVRDFDIFLPDSKPDFWVFLDISEFKGKKASLRSKCGDEKKGLELVYQSDDRTYLDNVYQEKRRPQLHFSTKRGWINDPNGLVYYDGEYHLFYQHNPYGFEWGNMHWGHAVSTDLVHWEQLPEALYPDEVGVAFSGSAVIDYQNTSGFKSGKEDVMVAIYTSTFFPDDAQEEAGMKVMERQSLAYSNDRGRTWTKYDGNPVIGDRSEELGSGNDRDPNVFWHKPTQKWVMILFERIGLSIFTSDNLKEWTHESHIEPYWECPELFELKVDDDPNQTRWVIYDGGGDYVIGIFDGKRFQVETGPHTYLEGDLFAAQTFENIPEEDGRQIQIGWATIPSPGMPFNMMMGFPTELSLRTTNDGIRMFNEPVSEISKLHTQSTKYEKLTLDEANEKLSDASSESLHLKFEVESINVMWYGLIVGGDNISYTLRTNSFIFNDEEKVFKYSPDTPSKRISYELIVDRTSIEVFINQGHFTMELPRNLDSDKQGVKFWTRNGEDLIIHNLEIYEMESIWSKKEKK